MDILDKPISYTVGSNINMPTAVTGQCRTTLMEDQLSDCDGQVTLRLTKDG
jgi:hypothetical protein